MSEIAMGTAPSVQWSQQYWPEAAQLTTRMRVYLALKGFIDVTGALLGIALCLPLWAILAIAIKLDSPGPVIFRQVRPGQWGQPFVILKFRTMGPDAEKRLEEVMQLNEEENGSLIRVQNDPRVTRLGRILRALSLDETPQFINVLRGEMSLVGPRPISRPIPDPRGLQRLAARPGMTGLWQVNGRKDTDCEFMLEKDMEYLKQRGTGLDMRIIGQTAALMFRPRGAR